MNMPKFKMIKPDSKGRITLGRLANGVSRFAVMKDKDKIVLVPYVEIPASEKWLFDNNTALNSVKRGLKDSAAGRVVSKGSFAQYIDEDIE